MRLPAAPKHLKEAGRTLWRTVLADYELDATALQILLRGCEAADRCEQARERIALDGPATTDRFGQLRAHPLLSVERDSRAATLASLKALNLDVIPTNDGPGRPAGR